MCVFSDAHPDNSNIMDVRKELGCIMYAANVLSSRGPRKMQAFLPRVDEHNNVSTWRPLHKDEEMVAKAKRRIMKDLQYLINKPPRWNDQVGAYVLNFNGRVTMASVKNFQLVDPEDQNTVTLQVGAKCSLAFVLVVLLVYSLVASEKTSLQWTSNGRCLSSKRLPLH